LTVEDATWVPLIVTLDQPGYISTYQRFPRVNV